MKISSIYFVFFVCVGVTFGDKKIIDCPKNCPTNVYKPICSRGRSYANLCVLKLEICKGNIKSDYYQDIEPCPGFNKVEDENGASVEMIDKNGVIFRSFLPNDDQVHSKKKNEKYSKRQYPAHYRREIRARLCGKSCPKRIAQVPVCVLGKRYKNSCTVKRLACAGKLPFAVLGLLEYCDETSEALENSRELEITDRWMDNFEIPIFRSIAKGAT